MSVLMLVIGGGLGQGGSTPPPATGVYYPEDFGAVGDGVTDDTGSVNAAIQAAGSGEVVQLGSKTYLVKASYLKTDTYQPQGLRLKSGVTLKGSGEALTTLKLAPPPAGATFASTNGDAYYFTTNAAFHSVITGEGVSGVTVKDLTVDGDYENQINYSLHPYLTAQEGTLTPNVITYGIYFSGGSGNTVDSVTVKNMPSAGVCYKNSPLGLVQYSYFTRNIFGAVMLYTGSNDALVQFCTAYDNHCDPFRVKADDCVVQDCESSHTITNPGTAARGEADFAGFYIENGRRSRFVRCTAHNNPAYGIDIWNYEFTQSAATACVVEDCHVHHNGNGGVRCSQSYAQIKDNLIEYNGRTEAGHQDPTVRYPFGVVIKAGEQYNEITGNTVRNNAYQTVAFGGEGTVSNTTVTNNTVEGGGTLLYGFDGAGNTVSGNTHT
jgi:hypothetical protein